MLWFQIASEFMLTQAVVQVALLITLCLPPSILRFRFVTSNGGSVAAVDSPLSLAQMLCDWCKNDRASVVGDAIEYIRELLRTLNALKSLAENKRQEKQRMMMMKRQKVVEEGGATELLGELEDSNNNYYSSYNIESLTSTSWIQRKSKETEVDVRIIDDEVTIKLVQRKKINCCLVYASRVLNEFKLDLQHVASGHVGDFCSFFINCKVK